MSVINFFRHGGRLAWGLIVAIVLVLASSTWLLADTAEVRLTRDITRMVFNHNVGLLDDIRKRVGAESDSLEQSLAASPELPANRPYLVVSLEDHRLWYKQGDATLFTTQVAVGSGRELVQDTGGGQHWQFDTPRGRLVVQSKDADPTWVPPEWHFVEQARKRGLGLIHLSRGQSIPLSDGSVITVDGNDVVKRSPDGREMPYDVGEGREIVANGNIVVPPFGTNQRKYKGVLGTYRLDLGDGYGIHGTDEPESIGRSVSHGCVRLRNEDIEVLYQMVPVGTPVYIY